MNAPRLLKALTLAATLSLAACGGPLRYQLQSSSRSPGADAELIAAINSDQSNTRIDLRVSNLPPATRIVPNATVFMVWQRRGPSASWSRVGTLNYNNGARTGQLRDTTVPETSFELQVTVEADANAGSPSPNVLFNQTVARPN